MRASRAPSTPSRAGGTRACEPHARADAAHQFLRVAPERRLVDLPGYGYAKVPERVRARWLELLEHYFNVRESLIGLVLIVDSRRGLGAEDTVMLEWMLARDRQAHILLTKSDKLNRRDAERVLRETRAACSDTSITAQLFSAHARRSREARKVMTVARQDPARGPARRE